MRLGTNTRWLIVAVATLVAVACSDTTPIPAEPRADARVTASATGLQLDGNPWWPMGFNAYELATNWSVNRGCGSMVDLDAYFGALPPRSLTRFNAFQSLATNRLTGQLDFQAVDAVFAAAEAHDQLVIPVLSPQDGSCEDQVFKDRRWFVDGWTAPPTSAPLSFADWIVTAVDRWKNSTSLAAWELVGEPETSTCGDDACSLLTRTCEPGAAEILRSFFDSAGALVRSHDPTTAITAGLTGGGQCGTQGDEYRFVGESPYVDIVQYHDYGADGVPLPGDEWNGLGKRIEQARSLGKPLLMGEIGELAGSCGQLTDRKSHIEAKISGQRAAGVAGALLWAFVPDPRPGDCTYDIGLDDPLWQLLGSS